MENTSQNNNSILLHKKKKKYLKHKKVKLIHRMKLILT